MKKYTLRVLIGLDQFVNTLMGGYPNETLSARAWRKGSVEGNAYWNTFRVSTDILFSPIESNHCQASYLYARKLHKVCGVYCTLYRPDIVENKPLPIDLPLEQ